ncbi:hypothetical protein Tco_0947638 [Tanacetum coccineum]
MLDSQGFISMMTSAQAFNLIQVMADHSHNWYNGASTWQGSNDSSDDIDMQKLEENIRVIQIKYIESLDETINKYCKESIKKQAAIDEWIRKFIENTDLNLRELDAKTKNLHVKAD